MYIKSTSFIIGLKKVNNKYSGDGKREARYNLTER